jgi:hypothetical protein
MKSNEPTESEDDGLPVPTVGEERHFLEQCDYVNRLLTAAGRHARRLLRQRGWESGWSEVDEQEIYTKTFPDGTTQHLDEWDAYYFEEDHTREWFRATGLAMKPRPKSPTS